MTKPIARIVIVGGGTAGWLAAAVIAARHKARIARGSFAVTLVESPDVATIGVGEGTWPTMRRTLARIGLSEAEVLRACDGSFKQGTRFRGWASGGADDVYYHPFTPPIDVDPADVAGQVYAEAVSAQPHACALGLAPRQLAMPDYAGALNYAYHLDAAKLAALLMRHATTRLGVRHLRDHVTGVDSDARGDIAAVRTRAGGAIAGDLFLDCSGHAALLIGDHFRVGTIDCGATLFNDRALAVQVPVAPDSPIAAQTDATAHGAGWIWDIGLPTRRGIGCVYASAFCSDDEAAATLTAYCAQVAPGVTPPPFRRLAFQSAYRERFWQGNAVAIGLSAGFLEPLEASAIVMVELSLDALLDDFPATAAVMPIQAQRFNALFRYRWERIVEFLKLHYVLSRRDDPYWRAHRDPATIPPRLADNLALWRHRAPAPIDLPAQDEVFPAASYRYVLYGMGMTPPPAGVVARAAAPEAALRQLDQRRRTLAASLPTLRAYCDALQPAESLAR